MYGFHRPDGGRRGRGESGHDHEVAPGALAVYPQLPGPFLAHEEQVQPVRHTHHVDEAGSDHRQGDVDLGPSGGGDAAHEPDDNGVEVTLGRHHEERGYGGEGGAHRDAGEQEGRAARSSREGGQTVDEEGREDGADKGQDR